ncbi:MAG: Asp-tRNA(Asn)/Glu-tRNA(Gln) amidotransferase subunit GatA, partial [Alphaproteobacteria bacterium]|nr:Asp-tRNA(Asn)/Glu-tRNA(Gln) amidotransferase subunit GatA [Alphaproteobacteria bacterium]
MTALTDLTMAEARDGLSAKQFSARELAEAYVAAMQAARPLNAFITETPERALAMADAVDARRVTGEARALDGVPIAVKDLFCTSGVPTTAASHILDGFTPPYESTVTEKLWAAGAVMLGKTNLDEFAMGSSNTTSYYGPVENPWRRPGDNRPLVPGGSSGGSAAAVASGMVPIATASDGGGSIRIPAACCGLVGMKPTRGRTSDEPGRDGWLGLSTFGGLARTVADSALMFDVVHATSLREASRRPP